MAPLLNISVPSGFTPANITPTPQVVVTGLNNDSSTPWRVSLPSFTGAVPTIAFTPPLPTNTAFTLTANSGNPCSTWAFPNIGNAGVAAA